jgi:hypothetical protein
MGFTDEAEESGFFRVEQNGEFRQTFLSSVI